MATILVVAGGNWLRVEVRTKVVAGEPKSGVCVPEHCGRLGQQHARQQQEAHDAAEHTVTIGTLYRISLLNLRRKPIRGATTPFVRRENGGQINTASGKASFPIVIQPPHYAFVTSVCHHRVPAVHPPPQNITALRLCNFRMSSSEFLGGFVGESQTSSLQEPAVPAPSLPNRDSRATTEPPMQTTAGVGVKPLRLPPVQARLTGGHTPAQAANARSRRYRPSSGRGACEPR